MTGCVDEAAVLRLQQQVASLEQQLDHPSVSQAKRCVSVCGVTVTCNGMCGVSII